MIIPEQIEKFLTELSSTSYGQALKAVLEQKKDELNNISTCKSYEEVLGRQHAINLINDIFKFMGEKKVENIKKNNYI